MEKCFLLALVVLLGSPTLAHGQLGNISTRAYVDAGDNVLIAGFIISGTVDKNVIVRALGPSLTDRGVAGALSDPKLEVYDQDGNLIDSDDNWKFPDYEALRENGLTLAHFRESALVLTLSPGEYTVIVRGLAKYQDDKLVGVGLVEVYDVDLTADSKLANISTRGLVQTADNVMIGGLILVGTQSQEVLVRALGPSLPVTGSLANPVLELHNSNGSTIATNDNWRSTQEAEIIATGIPPPNDLESSILVALAPGAYTAIVHGVNGGTGIALLEIYALE